MSLKDRIIAMGIMIVPLSSLDYGKPLATLIPNITGIDSSEIYQTGSPEYLHFVRCANQKESCDPVAPAHFFQLSGSEGTDRFDIMNRCVAVSASGEGNQIGFPTFDASGNVTCNTQKNDVVALQLVACYERLTGAYCTAATACFAGVGHSDQCAKDYPDSFRSNALVARSRCECRRSVRGSERNNGHPEHGNGSVRLRVGSEWCSTRCDENNDSFFGATYCERARCLRCIRDKRTGRRARRYFRSSHLFAGNGAP
ncbi:MAG: hypothetical protein H7301_01165 [Cryobacterium sp.]|nr:hypothetical protein [Oligoflexia bacterium]